MPSGRLIQLKTGVLELRRLLLPHRFDPTGTYGDPERVRARALSFRVLAHAEIESYFEDRVIDTAKAAWKAWKEQRRVSSVAISLLGFSGREMQVPARALHAPSPNKRKEWAQGLDLKYRIEECVSDFVKKVMLENHGVKEKNILAMLLPIGFDYRKCDSLFLTTLSQFGEARGTAAHASGASYITQAVDPSEEYKLVSGIIIEIEKLDADLDALLAETVG